ncbi:TPA: hypothetical protein ACV8JD_005574, partial [Escherichia coli]
ASKVSKITATPDAINHLSGILLFSLSIQNKTILNKQHELKAIHHQVWGQKKVISDCLLLCK